MIIDYVFYFALTVAILFFLPARWAIPIQVLNEYCGKNCYMYKMVIACASMEQIQLMRSRRTQLVTTNVNIMYT